MDRTRAGSINTIVFVVGTSILVATVAVTSILSGDGDLKKLRTLLDRAEEASADPVLQLEKDNRMILLIRRVEPLDTDEKIAAVLDIFLLPEDGRANAPRFAREALLQYPEAAYPAVQARLDTDEDPPPKLQALAAEIEKRLPEETAEEDDPADEDSAAEKDADAAED